MAFMIRFLCIYLSFLVILQAEGYLPRYRVTPEGSLYKFSTNYRAKFTSPDEIRTLNEQIEGKFEDKQVKELEDGVQRVERRIHVETYIHNGTEESIDPELADLSNYEYILDPRKGKVKLTGNKTYDAEDAMEMVVAFPRKEIQVGDTWKADLFFNLKQSGARIPLRGAFKLMDVQGNIARIVGKYSADIKPTKALDYQGGIKWDSEFYFNLSKGEIERGKFVIVLKYFSRSNFAKTFYLQSNKKERIGYAFSLTSSFHKE